MNVPEQADSSAERSTKPTVLERLNAERDLAGSTLNYVSRLAAQYSEQPGHKSSLYMLQRMAGAIVDPLNEPGFPTHLVNAFYWGEILAYRTQELLSEDEWEEDGYAMLNQEMTRRANAFREDDLSFHDNARLFSDSIMSELETPDMVMMPPAMEQIIVEWSDEFGGMTEDQWHMILGYRHITMLITERAARQASILEEIAELQDEVKGRDEYKQAFYEMMDLNEVNDLSGNLLPINSLRDTIMESFADHASLLEDFDDTDDEAVDSVRQHLVHMMNKDFETIDEVKEGDLLRFGEKMIYVMFDEEGGLEAIHMLGKDEYLEAVPDSIGIVDLPTTNGLLQWQKGEISEDALEDDVTRFGVIMLIKDLILVDSKDNRVVITGKKVAGVIMSNPHMTISKYLV